MSFLSRRTHVDQGPAAAAAQDLAPLFVLVLLAYAYLVRFDLFLARGDFATLCDKVRQFPTSRVALPPMVERLSKAMDLAVIGYWKRVLCLQRSAATVCFFRRFGVPAQMIIGSQQMPFKAHAWVEVEDHVVNDRSYIREIYAVLDRW